MKLIRIITVFILLPMCCSAHQVAVGYNSKYAKIWRFYEQGAKGNMIPKILIYNITDDSITFCMKVVLPGRALQKSDRLLMKQYIGLDNDTVIRTVMIPAHGYGVYETETKLTNKSTSFMDEVIINGIGAGIMEVREPLVLSSPRYKYYSHEGVGNYADCLIGTDNLLITSGTEGSMSLYYKCAVTKLNYPAKEWQFEPFVEKGIATVRVCKEDGQCYTVRSGQDKLTFPVNIEKLDSFSLQVRYSATQSDSPTTDIYLTHHFCNGCSQTMALPVFLKQE